MLGALTFDPHLTLDVDRRQPDPPPALLDFWSALPRAATAHIAPTVTSLAPDTGAAIAVMGTRHRDPAR